LQTRRAAIAIAMVARRFYSCGPCAAPKPPCNFTFDAALKPPRIFLFATLAAAVISVVLPMNSQPERRPSILPEQRSTRAALESLARPTFHRSHVPFVPAAGIPRIISIISSG
jgi:hypothetical protein